MSSLKKRAAQLHQKQAKDFDPEDDAPLRTSDNDASLSEDDEAEVDGREHYEVVGRGNLRRPEQPTLGAKYGGVAVSREALEDGENEDDPFAPVDDDEEDDPFAVRPKNNSESEQDADEADEADGPDLEADIDEDDEIASDEALGESDVERFKHMKFRGSKTTSIHTTQSEEEDASDTDMDDISDEDEDDSGDPSDVEDTDDDGEEEDASSVSSAPTPPSRHNKPARSADREEFRRQAQASSSAELASALSAGINADVKKGQAVKMQRQTFDRLLDVRIKLQKGIGAMNELPAGEITDEEVRNAAQRAEDAALALWSTIDSIRCNILAAQDNTSTSTKPKRKQPLQPTRSTSLSEVWKHTTDLESQAQPNRRTVLDKWHTKTQPLLDSTTSRSKLLKPSHQPASRLTDVLDTYLLSTTTTQSTSGVYEDTTFYQSLLRDLVTSRSTTSTAASNLTSINNLPPKLHTHSKNHIHTKASKGRKIRYTVHEKLENFMAGEDRNTWTDSARREFFGSLLGNGNVLGEDVDDDVDDAEDEDERKGEALRLFKS